MTLTVAGHAFPADRWYDPREHVWARPDGDGLVTVGVDALGQEALGDVVYVQLVDAGVAVARGDAVGSLEAEKMVRPLLAPVSGTVAEVNAALVADPRLLNRDPYGAGWLLRLRATRWETEAGELLHGDETVGPWASAEIARAEETA